MDKGIRINVNAKFAELLVERNARPADCKTRNKQFRKEVMLWAMQEFDVSLASAATHYNHALKLAQAGDPASVEGLGRAEDKKGGRKPKSVAQAAGDVNSDLTPDLGEAQTLFVVKKKKDDSVIAEGLTAEAARALCEAAVTAKKAKLYWV